jgi:RNA polymerase-binding transcription factor DksA
MTAPMVASRADAVPRRTLSSTDLRALLLRELAAQVAQASDWRTTLSSLTGENDVVSLMERETAEASANRADEAIADVQHALARLDTGTYGTCEQCGEAIPVERLEAIPSARQCVDCSGQRAGLLD